MLEINNENNKKNRSRRIQNTIFWSVIVTIAFLSLFINSESNFVEVYSQEQDKQQESSSNSSIALTAKLIDDEYRWIDSNNSINPTLNMTSGVENQITIKSLKGDSEEHEIVIEGISAASEGEGEELIASDEIEGGSSTAINFNPADIQKGDSSSSNNYQSLEYYCEYHPDTMRGKIQIIK